MDSLQQNPGRIANTAAPDIEKPLSFYHPLFEQYDLSSTTTMNY